MRKHYLLNLISLNGFAPNICGSKVAGVFSMFGKEILPKKKRNVGVGKWRHCYRPHSVRGVVTPVE